VLLERRRYRSGEAAGYRLVVSATGIADVDGAVAADAEAAGVWVNSADDAERCTFLLPSVHRDGSVSIAVSTGGASPALATWLRRRVADDLGPGLGILAALLEEARQRVHAEGRSTEAIDWPALLDGALPALVRPGDSTRPLVVATATSPVPGPPEPVRPSPVRPGPVRTTSDPRAEQEPTQGWATISTVAATNAAASAELARSIFHAARRSAAVVG